MSCTPCAIFSTPQGRVPTAARTVIKSNLSVTVPVTTGAMRWIQAKSNAKQDGSPAETFESGLAKTVGWYLDNNDWVERVVSGSYRDWVQKNYSDR